MAEKKTKTTKAAGAAKKAGAKSSQSVAGEAEKLRALGDAELGAKHKEMTDQLFRLKFQRTLGQTESLNKIRGLRKDIARANTIARERQLAAAGSK